VTRRGSLGFLDRLPARRGPGTVTGLKLCHQGGWVPSLRGFFGCQWESESEVPSLGRMYGRGSSFGQLLKQIWDWVQRSI